MASDYRYVRTTPISPSAFASLSSYRKGTFMTVCKITGQFTLAALIALTGATFMTDVRAEDSKDKQGGAKPATEAKPETIKADAATTSGSSSGGSSSSSSSKSKYPAYSDVLKDAKTIDGLLKLHQKDSRLYAEIDSSHMNRDFIVLTAIARGIGEGQLLGGMTWGFGDDSLWQFRKVEDNIQIVRRNVRFRASRGTPEEKAVKLAYTDSVLFALPIATLGPGGAAVVDLSPVFMSDLPQISHVLPGFSFSSNKSSWAAVKGFKDNIELEVAATYASGGTIELDTVPDSRGVSINIHYSISLLPDTGYTPRYADDRVGYFLTAVKDFSKKGEQDRFDRFINRWDLQKADPSAEISPPKKPIIFWIERTVPYQYRAAIRDGILEWNKAFEKAGFSNAIEVRQQPDNADWDPEDINYNTFRWITAGAGFAMGPSRVNPINGQILDADIIFDADFVQFWKREYEMFTPQSIAAMTGGALDIPGYEAELAKIPLMHRHSALCRCELHNGMARELALGSTALLARSDAALAAKEQDKLIMQGLKEVTMHEVGHTLGLRHNFKASTMLSLKDINNLEKTRQSGMLSSVMDYAPPNIVPKDYKQGDYYSTTIGPYDMWAIEYGYKPLSGGVEGETSELKKIAAKGAEQGLSYATDEDTRGIDPDPLTNRFDLGSDPLEFAKARTKLVGELMPSIVEKVTKEGEGYQKARQAFGVLLGNYGQSVFMAARFVGGVEVNRDHKGDTKGRAPFVVVSADKQREALKLVEDLVLSDKPFNFPPELYNHLAATRWNHWGVNMPMRTDYAVHEVILMWQQRIIDQLTSSLVLDRLHDSELRVAADKDAFTTAELLSRLTNSVFSEIDKLSPGDYSNRKPAISSLRRNLQRAYLKRLASLALGSTGAPEDCQTVAYGELVGLESRLKKQLAENSKLDTYTRAHLQESSDRIHKVLDARLTFVKP
jgi:hypothetical protein